MTSFSLMIDNSVPITVLSIAVQYLQYPVVVEKSDRCQVWFRQDSIFKLPRGTVCVAGLVVWAQTPAVCDTVPCAEYMYAYTFVVCIHVRIQIRTLMIDLCVSMCLCWYGVHVCNLYV